MDVDKFTAATKLVIRGGTYEGKEFVPLPWKLLILMKNLSCMVHRNYQALVLCLGFTKG